MKFHLATEAFGPAGEILSLYIDPAGQEAGVMVTDGVERRVSWDEQTDFLNRYGVDNPWSEWTEEKDS